MLLADKQTNHTKNVTSLMEVITREEVHDFTRNDATTHQRSKWTIDQVHYPQCVK